MDATNGRRRRGLFGRRRRRRRHQRDPQPSSPSPSAQPQSSQNTLAFEQPHVFDFVENKMGLPPPYEPSHSNPAPPPSYFGDNPPPPPGLVVPPTAPRTTVITSGAPLGAQNKMGPGPTGTTCRTCNKSIVTRVEYAPNNRTHIISAALCIVASCCCGCFIPYCMRSCKTANHYCPQCNAFVGSYTPS